MDDNHFDVEDRPTNIVTAESVTITNSYDALHRVLERAVAGAGRERFVYGAAGLTSYTNQLSERVQLAYDAAARLTNRVFQNSSGTSLATNQFTYKVELDTPTNAPGMPREFDGALGQLLGYERFSKRSQDHLRQAKHPSTMPASECCPGQRKNVVWRVYFISARSVRFQSGMRLSSYGAAIVSRIQHEIIYERLRPGETLTLTPKNRP